MAATAEWNGSTASAGNKLPALATDHIEPRRLVTFIAMVFGMFMAILDIQIVSASLTEIQAGLAASSNEISWVQTAYLIAEVVMIPLSGFLSRALGTRILFAASAAGFTAASLMCGLSTSINEMIVWRLVQGFIGGAMIPTVFATAGLTTILNDRTDLHLARLHEAVTWSHPAALEALNILTTRFQSYGSDAHATALKQLTLLTHQQGVVMAFADVFFLLTILFVVLGVGAMLMKKPTQIAGGAGGH